MIIIEYKDYVCSQCFKQLTDCECEVQSYKLIWIDQEIQGVVEILNKKGYRTEFCCIGHTKGSTAYIQFIFPNTFDLPKGWKSNKHKTNIYYTYMSNDFEQEQKQVIEGLTQWAKELKDKYK